MCVSICPPTFGAHVFEFSVVPRATHWSFHKFMCTDRPCPLSQHAFVKCQLPFHVLNNFSNFIGVHFRQLPLVWHVIEIMKGGQANRWGDFYIELLQLRIIFMHTHCLQHMIATYWDYDSRTTWLSSKPISSVPCANTKGARVFAQAPPPGPVHRIANKREQPICKQQHTASSMPPVQRRTAPGARL